jgi:hypothetical protein
MKTFGPPEFSYKQCPNNNVDHPIPREASMGISIASLNVLFLLYPSPIFNIETPSLTGV